MLLRGVSQEPLPVAVEDGAGREHLGVEQRVLREAPENEAEVTVGSVHHRSDGQGAHDAPPTSWRGAHRGRPSVSLVHLAEVDHAARGSASSR